MALPSVTHSFTASTTIESGQVNTNFNDIINSLTDGTKSLSIDALTSAGAILSGTTLESTTTTTVGTDLTVDNDATITGELTISGTGTHSVTAEFANEVIEEYERATGTSVTARGVAISASSSTFSTTSTSATDVTNLSVTIVTTGRPVMVLMTSIEASNIGAIGPDAVNAVSQLSGDIYLVRDSTQIFRTRCQTTFDTSDNAYSIFLPMSGVTCIDDVSAGTYTYKVQASSGTATNVSMRVNHCKLVAFEL